MFKSLVVKSIQLGRFMPVGSVPRMLSSLLRNMSVFDELKNLESATKKNASTIFDIDELIANSPGLQTNHELGLNYDSYAFGNTEKHPRDVAKELSLTGTQAGRTVEVKQGNVSQSLKVLFRLLRDELIISMKFRQKRHLRPALLHDRKHRLWWRKNFAARFSELLGQVRDAKRRGY